MGVDTVTIQRQTAGAPSPLVAVGDICQMFDPPLNASTPDQWRRRYPEFPHPWNTSGGHVWLRSEVEEWLRATGRASFPG